MTEIYEAINEIKEPTCEEVRGILDKAGKFKGLTIEEALKLLLIKDDESLSLLFHSAREIKKSVFGRRIVLFAPLYLSNYCINNCLYCGFRKDNSEAERRRLTLEEVLSEVKYLEEKGLKRVLLVLGEDYSRFSLKDLIKVVDSIYKETGMRIVHVNAPPMDVEPLRCLKEAGVGVFQAFQETYHKPTYEEMHPSGRKRDFNYRFEVMDRAFKAGFEDVGIGTLLGLFDYKFDVLATISHSYALMERFGSHAHTISLPRLRPASGVPLKREPYTVSDDQLKKIVAVYRLSVPSAGIVVTTREREALRRELIHLGASQLSAGSTTEPGGYTVANVEGSEGHAGEQFPINDHRSIEVVIASIVEDGLLPSLCTSCYRVGRTGPVFTHKSLTGEMEPLCHSNAILTLQEYLLDHATNCLKEIYREVIEGAVLEIKDRGMKEGVKKRLRDLEAGKRDIFF
ncbi:MAG: [FeFe] hydrogenase H-cluster radical SAM maturase HydG [Thermodesulfobacteriota bacterium]